MIEDHRKAGEVSEVGLPHRCDQNPLTRALGPGPDHDGRAVGVVGTEIDRLVSAEFLEADEDVGLDVFDEVAEVDVAVGVGERRGHKQAALR